MENCLTSNLWILVHFHSGLWLYLVVKFEECIVDDEIVPLEPLEEVADDGEPVDHSGGHGEAVLVAGAGGEPLLPLGGSQVSERSRSSHFPPRIPSHKSEIRASLLSNI